MSPEEEVGSRQLKAAGGQASQQGEARKGPGRVGREHSAAQGGNARSDGAGNLQGVVQDQKEDVQVTHQSVNFIQRAVKARFKQLCCVVRHNSM